MLPKVDTFSQNIAEEIRRKEASLAQIQGEDIPQNKEPILPKKNLPLIFIIGPFLLVCILLLAGVAYFFFPTTQKPLQEEQQSTPVTVNNEKTLHELTKLSPTLASQIGRFVSRTEKRDAGYIITITSYPSVFAYMTRNEESYINELATLFPAKVQATSTQAQMQPEKKALATTTELLPSSASTTKATSTIASSTKITVAKNQTKVATTTPKTVEATTTVKELEIPLVAITSPFKDITIANQNMRIWSNNTHTVVYAFIDDTKIIISDNPEKVLLLKGVILK
jgi:hypothetical protein